MQPSSKEEEISLQKQVSVRERLQLWENTILQRKESQVVPEPQKLKRQHTVVGASFHKKSSSIAVAWSSKPSPSRPPFRDTTLRKEDQNTSTTSLQPIVPVPIVETNETSSSTIIKLNDPTNNDTKSNEDTTKVKQDVLLSKEENLPSVVPYLSVLKKFKEKKRADSIVTPLTIEEVPQQHEERPLPSKEDSAPEEFIQPCAQGQSEEDSFLKTEEVHRLKRFSSLSGPQNEPISAAFLATDLKILSTKTEKDIQHTYLKNFRKNIFNESTLNVFIENKNQKQTQDDDEEPWETFYCSTALVGFESYAPTYSSLYFDPIYPSVETTCTFAEEEQIEQDQISNFEVFISNPLLEEETMIVNPLFEEEILTKNPLFEQDIVMINPLFRDTRNVQIHATSISKEMQLIQTLRSKVEIKDRLSSSLKSIHKCFTGSELVDVLLEKGKQRWIRLDAVAMAQQLMDRLIFKHAEVITETKFKDCSTSYYRFTEDFYHKNWLNTFKENTSTTPRRSKPASTAKYEEALFGNSEIIRQLQLVLSEVIEHFTFQNNAKNMVSMLDKYFKPHLQLFDYTTFASSSTYSKLQHVAFLLQFLNPLQLNHRQERLAFFINLYNMMFLHGLVVLGRPRNLLLRDKFNKNVKYIIGNLIISLDDIKHIVLQCSKREVWITTANALENLFQWESKSECEPVPSEEVEQELKNPLLQCCVFQRRTDPRIHFALITGCISSPPLTCYEASTVDELLTQQTSIYLQNEGLQIDLQEKLITIPQIMNWYIEDFPDPHLEQRIRWMCPYLTVDQRAKTNILLDQHKDDYGVKFYTYNWSLNHISLRENPHLIRTILRLENQHNLFGMIRNATNWKRVQQQWEQEEELFYQSIQIPMEQTISNPAYRRYFVFFCKTEHSAENILFWIQVEQFKKEEGFLEDAAWKIYSTFLEQNKAPMEVNVSKESVEQVLEKLQNKQLTNHIFDSVQQLISLVMQDTYSRFKSSPFYKQLVKSIFGEEEDLDDDDQEEELDEEDAGTATSSSNGDKSQGSTTSEKKKSKQRSGTSIFEALKFDSASANEDVTNWTPMTLAKFRASSLRHSDSLTLAVDADETQEEEKE